MLDAMEARMLLGVDAGASRAQIKAAFRRRVRAMHPDSGGLGGDAAAFVAAQHVLLRAAPIDPRIVAFVGPPRDARGSRFDLVA